MIANRYANSNELSFEDLNNVSQTVLGDISDMSIIDPDLQAMNLKVLKDNSLPSSTPSADKIAMFQEQLKRIKQEVETDEVEVPLEVKQELATTPVKIEVEVEVKEEEKKKKTEEKVKDKKESELDILMDKLKSVINEGNKDAAKKHMNSLNELLENKKDQNEMKNILHVQPVIRQDTFEIDPENGKRKYNPNSETEKTHKTETEDIMEKLAKLLSGQSLNVHSVDLGQGDTNNAKLVFVVPTPVTTPMKNTRLSVAPRAQSAMKAIETKKMGTPMKRVSQVSRPSLFTTPRPTASSRVPATPYDQKLSVQSRAGAVRKSLLSTIEKTPQIQKTKVPSTPNVTTKTIPSHAKPRRSISMKASIPAVHVSKSSPLKAVPRPSTGAPYATASANNRLSQVPPIRGRPSTTRALPSPRPRTKSEHKNPVSKFKAPSALRKAAAATACNDSGSLV